jgi:hypothetical protein
VFRSQSRIILVESEPDPQRDAAPVPAPTLILNMNTYSNYSFFNTFDSQEFKSYSSYKNRFEHCFTVTFYSLKFLTYFTEELELDTEPNQNIYLEPEPQYFS